MTARPASESLVEARLRELGKVLTDHLGGGSEWFSRVGDDFYIDPEAVRSELQRRKTDAQITKKALFRARAALSAHAGEGWRPIETAPKRGDIRVDLWIVRTSASGRHHDEHRVPNCYWDERKDRWRTNWLRSDGHPPIPPKYVATHWQPLPPPPGDQP